MQGKKNYTKSQKKKDKKVRKQKKKSKKKLKCTKMKTNTYQKYVTPMCWLAP